jgi:FkbM family methyltransferase
MEEDGMRHAAIDVGAGVGVETLLFSRLVGPTGRVVAIEAHPRTFRCLERLVSHHQLENVAALNLAVGAREGRSMMSSQVAHRSNAVGDAGAGAVEVMVARLDALLADHNVDRIDLLKMNIEGAEVAALEGMGALLRRTVHVCVSCHDFKAARTGDEMLCTRSEVTRLLRDAGFELRSRPDDARPAVRDYVYGTRGEASAASCTEDAAEPLDGPP